MAAGLIAALNAQSQVVFSDNFNSYTNGNLAGQGAWTQNGASATTPIQVNNGAVVVGTSGQDVNALLTTGLSWANTSDYAFNFGATINVQSVAAAGDYFMHWSPTTNSTVFLSRLFAKSDGGSGFQLGYLETSGTGGATVYGQSLLLNQDYSVVIRYNANAGALNDTADIFVNGNLYLSDTWTTTTVESTALGAVNLRQGTAANAPLVTVDNMFVEVVPVPEPTSMALIGLGMAGLLIFRRRN